MKEERKLYINSGYAVATYIGLNIGMAFIGLHFNLPGSINIYFLLIYIVVITLFILSLIKFYKNRSKIRSIKNISKIETVLLIINQFFLLTINYFDSKLIIIDEKIHQIKGMNLLYLIPMVIVLIYIRRNSTRYKLNKIF